MKKVTYIMLMLAVILTFNLAEAKTIKVKSYFKPSTGKYIYSYHKTSPNKTRLDNYSTKYNYNPYTGKKGYVNPSNH